MRILSPVVMAVPEGESFFILWWYSVTMISYSGMDAISSAALFCEGKEDIGADGKIGSVKKGAPLFVL